MIVDQACNQLLGQIASDRCAPRKGNIVPRGDYKHPPIEEASCEFRFTLPAGAPQWDLALPGKFQMHQLIKDTYTGVVRQQNLQTVTADQNQPSVSIQNALFRVQIPTADGTKLVGLARSIQPNWHAAR